MCSLEIENLTQRYRHDVVVDDLRLTVEPGRVTGFLGPNGAGTSTTMQNLLTSPPRAEVGPRSAAPASGTWATWHARWESFSSPTRSTRAAAAVTTSGSSRTAPASTPARIEEVLEMAGIANAADRRVGAYSLGMRQRLGIAAALLGDPPLLVLDEPGNGLDPQGIRWLRDLLRARAAADGLVFVSSHLLAEVEQRADELVVVNRGRLVATGALSTLRKAGVSVNTPEPQALTRILTDAGASVHAAAEGRLVVRGLPIAEIGDRACAAGIALHELAPDADSLEELFLDWTEVDRPVGEPPAEEAALNASRTEVVVRL